MKLIPLFTLLSAGIVLAPTPASALEVPVPVTGIASLVPPAYVEEIVFVPGESGADPLYRARLENTLRDARIRGRIDQALVLAWGDETDLTNDDPRFAAASEIAAARARSLDSFLRAGPVPFSVRTFNMVTTPGALADLRVSGDARLRAALGAASLLRDGPRPRVARAWVILLLSPI